MITVEVFKTNVINKKAANLITAEIRLHQPQYKCNFDLEDCDKVLRIENKGEKVDAGLILKILKKNNYEGEILK